VCIYGTPVNILGKYICLLFLDGSTRWFDPDKDIIAQEEHCCYWNKYYLTHRTFMEKETQ